MDIKRLTHAVFLILIFLNTSIYAQSPGTDADIAKYRKGIIKIKTKPGSNVMIEQQSHEFWFGCAISNGFVNGTMKESDRKAYEENFLKNFNSAVTENAVKWGNMESRQSEVNYKVVDSILAWTERHHIPLRAHNVFWGIEKFVQPWLKEMNDSILRVTLEQRAQTLASHYKGRFIEYDLNNEMVHGNYYEQRLGPLITYDMAKWMHQGDPSARLFLNDYDILTGAKLPEYMTQVRTLLQQGVPIAGIGVQGHLHTDTFDRYQLKRALDSLAIFGLPIRITEFNMPGQRSKYLREKILTMTPEEEALKAHELVDYYKICFAHPAVTGMVMWGFWAGANWIPTSSLYRQDWTATPAADAYHKLIYEDWWTKTMIKADKKGWVTVPAFYGRYKVSAGSKTREVFLTKKSGGVEVKF
ncbi:MAG: endo-1,4-beta-xylanase [Saprospiraceae bacterium]